MNIIEKLRNELYKCINKYGRTNKKTIEKSQELDRALNNQENINN